MRKLILVRHSLPDIVPEIPANLWRLSREGRRRCKILAAKLAGHKPCLIVTCLESKALETGQLVASMLELPQAAAAGIHEHERRSVAFCADEAKFQASVVRMLEQPGQPVFGDETGDQAHQRFSQAIDSVIEHYARATWPWSITGQCSRCSYPALSGSSLSPSGSVLACRRSSLCNCQIVACWRLSKACRRHTERRTELPCLPMPHSLVAQPLFRHSLAQRSPGRLLKVCQLVQRNHTLVKS